MKTYSIFKTIYRALNILVVLMMMINAPLSVFAYTTTDKPDYQPGEVVTISGDNRDGSFYQEGVVVDVVVTGPTGDNYLCTSEPALVDGSWSCQVTLSSDPAIAVGSYTYVTMQNGVVIEEGNFTDAAPPSIQQLWQCDPPSVFDPNSYTCVSAGSTGWVTGNDDGPFFEGDTIPYRTRFQNLVVGETYNLTIEWDTTKSGKHAIDYLKSFNATILATDPCVSLNGLPAGLCDGAPSTFPIPADTFMQSDAEWIANGGVQDSGEFTMFGGTIDSLSGYTVPANYLGDTATSITLFFTANNTDVVLAWGGHIAERADWGIDNSAVFISGSPYHMRITKFGDNNVGNMDRSLSAEAIIYPAHVTIVKEADPQGDTPFNFSGDLGNFTLYDNGVDPNYQTFEVSTFMNYTITESLPTGWELLEIVCEPLDDVVNITLPSAVIDVDEADNITCYFRNKLQTGNIIVQKFTDPSGSSQVFEFNPSWSDTNFFLSDGQSNDSGPLLAGNYSVEELVPSGWELSNAVCDDGSLISDISLQAGETVTCTFSNFRLGENLVVTKTAFPHFTRTYTWDITKTAESPITKYGFPGDMVEFAYEVSVNHDAGVDSDWYVDGVITISNPNDWQAVTLSTLSDSAPGGNCVLDPGPYVVPAGGVLNVDYQCDFASGAGGTNTATATWDATLYRTPSGSALGTANYAFTTPTSIVDESITVTDSAHGVLGNASVGESMPKAFNYNHSWEAVGGTCTDYPNVASFVANDTGATDSDNAEVTVCSGADLTVSKTASGTFGRTYLWDITKVVDKTSVNIADGGLATFNYSVNVFQTGIVDSGWSLSGVITVSNPNDWQAVTLDNLTDVVDNGGVCTVDPGPYVVPASDSINVNYSCDYAADPTSYTGTNTATASWDMVAYFTPTGSAQGMQNFTLSQSGSTNKTVNVTDTLGGNLGSVMASDSAPYTSQTFEYSMDFEGVGGTCTDYDNTATITETGQSDSASVTVCVGLDLTVSKTASGNFDREYLWDITKVVDQTSVNIADDGSATFNYTVDVFQTGVLDSNWTLSGVITVSNPNDWQAVTLDSLTDVVDNGGVCVVAPGPYNVPASGSINVNYSCSFAGMPSSYSGINTATATWNMATYFTPSGSAQGTENFELTQLGSVNKTVNVTDSLGGPLGSVMGTDGEPFASQTFEYSLDFEGVGGTCTVYDNTATITQTGQTDSASVTVCVGLDLTVTKTGSGTFDRTYLWDIDKNVDRTTVEAMIGDLVTFNYAVDVWQTGFSDSNFAMSGQITISNPNDWEAITADVTDVYPGGVCVVTGGEDVVVPASDSVVLSYSCTFAGVPVFPGINTATATWDEIAFHTPTGSANGTANVNFVKDAELNKLINVTDTYAGDLGTVEATDAEPFASETFLYSRDILVEEFLCQTYDNVATITETGQNDSASVEVCADYWAFTPGFWKNHTSDSRSGHDAWKYTDYTTDMLLGNTFDLGVIESLSPKGAPFGEFFSSMTLLDALRFKGGSGLSGAGEILMRAAVASLLNASFHEVIHGGVEGYFPYSSAEVKALVAIVLMDDGRSDAEIISDMLSLASELDEYNNGIHEIDWNMPVP